MLAVACEDLVENRRLDLEPPKLAPAHAAARVLCLGVDRHEAQEDLPRGLPRRRIESLVELLGATAERADDAARRAVALVRQEVARPAREQLRERVLEERQRPRLVVHVGHDLRDEAGLEANTHLRGGRSIASARSSSEGTVTAHIPSRNSSPNSGYESG